MYRDDNQRDFARQLRNNLTDAEKELWHYLRAEQLYSSKFRRQAAIGLYVVDFVCFELRIVIELDGGQHNEEEAKQYDARRTAWLNSQGFQVLRYWNHEVMKDVEAVVEAIGTAIQNSSHSQISPPPQGEGV